MRIYHQQVAADRRLLHTPSARQLQSGLLSFAALCILLHIVHVLAIKTITLTGLAIGALVMVRVDVLCVVEGGITTPSNPTEQRTTRNDRMEASP